MRFIIIAAIVVLLPAALLGTPTIGVYFDNPGQMDYYATFMIAFNGLVYVHNWECQLVGVEFEVALAFGSLMYGGFTVPSYMGYIGDPVLGGISIIWPTPITGSYLHVCTVNMAVTDYCVHDGGPLGDLPVFVTNHSISGQISGTCWPDMYLIDLVGLTSTVCPVNIAVEDASWGAIKSVFIE